MLEHNDNIQCFIMLYYVVHFDVLITHQGYY